jgi:aminodeoxyfutalosine synthase
MMTRWSLPRRRGTELTEKHSSTDWRQLCISPNDILKRITDEALIEVGRKFFAGSQLDLADGLACLETPDLAGLGTLASAARRARFGDRAFYVVNHHINYTNICINGCKFCAFHRLQGSSEGYLLNPEEVAAQIRRSGALGLREVHLVGAINPEPDFSYYLDLLRAIKRVGPDIHVKAFTAVEIDHIAKRASLSWTDCLAALHEAGLDALPGGGAEVFSERVRRQLFPSKIGADTWLAIHGTAHRLGIGTNATLLFGHIETPEERIEHLLRLRAQQEETGGFRAFIPLVFHPGNTSLSDLPGPTGVETLKTIATARLILSNIPHLKAYWVMLGLKLAQTALHFGADDLEGTIVAEKIAHQAGAETAVGLTRQDLEQLILSAGLIPAERDTFHQAIRAA